MTPSQINRMDAQAIKSATPTYNATTGHVASSSAPVVLSTPSSAKQSSLNSYSPSSVDYNSVINSIKELASENSAKSQEMVEKQWKFNMEEAQKNRDWQEYMSNTAHQREVADLIAAGLNPVLSAGGNGASVTAGATASGAAGSVDTSGISAIGNFIGTLINSATSILNTEVNAKSNLAVADIYKMSNLGYAEIMSEASKYGAKLSSQASKYGADVSADTANKQFAGNIISGLLRLIPLAYLKSKGFSLGK